ncbi:MAG: hypothetical protein ACRC2T_19095 [Thermoguttaceae bacterium]
MLYLFNLETKTFRGIGRFHLVFCTLLAVAVQSSFLVAAEPLKAVKNNIAINNIANNKVANNSTDNLLIVTTDPLKNVNIDNVGNLDHLGDAIKPPAKSTSATPNTSASPKISENLNVKESLNKKESDKNTGVIENIPFSESITYPQELHARILTLIKESEESETKLEQSTIDSLNKIITLLGEIDYSVQNAPGQLISLLLQLEAEKDLFANDKNNLFRSQIIDIQLMVERRLVILSLSAEPLALEKEETLNGISGIKPRTVEDFNNLKLAAENLITHLSKIRNSSAEEWERYFELIDFSEIINEVTDEQTELTYEQLYGLCEYANIILQRFEGNFTKEQKRFLQSAPISKFRAELQKWADNTVTASELIAAVENYESTGRTTESGVLSEVAFRLSVCPDEKLSKLGSITREIYGGPNVKIYVSQVLVNHFLPVRDPEFVSFRDTVLGREVVGQRKTDTFVEFVLEPDPEKLCMALSINGKVAAAGKTKAAIAAKLQSDTFADYTGVKKFEWTEKGILVKPAKVAVSNKTYLRSVSTGFDGVPIIGGVAREVVRGQFEAQEDQINAESRAKIAYQVQNRINQEADKQFATFNENFNRIVNKPLENSNLVLEKKHACTTNEWLLSSWRVVSNSSLGSHTPEPETVKGAFADFKLHESALETVIQSLEIEGKTITIGELRKLIAERIDEPEFASEPEENDDVVFSFAEKDPIMVRFNNGRLEISLTLAAMKVNRSVWRNFRFIANYRPIVDENGDLAFQRDDDFIVIGQRNLRTQVALRTVFSKIFPLNRRYTLVPNIFKTDERFAELTTGMCRLENGWFAIAIVGKETE